MSDGGIDLEVTTQRLDQYALIVIRRMPDSGRCCCLCRLLEDRVKTGCWRISALKCASGKLVGLGSLEWGETSVCSLN